MSAGLALISKFIPQVWWTSYVMISLCPMCFHLESMTPRPLPAVSWFITPPHDRYILCKSWWL
jgi:hypothetical protein